MAKLIIATTILGVVAVASAYDFSDSTFNNFLSDTLDESYSNLYQVPFTHRNRRGVGAHEEKCYFHSKINCCGEGSQMTISDEARELKGKCFKDNFSEDDFKTKPDPFSCEKIKEMKKKFVCVANCMAEGGKLIENGEINKDNVHAFVEKTFGMEDFKKEMTGPIIDKCIPIAKAAAEKAPTEDGACSPLALKMMHCMWRNYQLDCPADKVQTTPLCNKIIEILKANDAE